MYEFRQCLNIPEKLGKYNLQLEIAEKCFHSDAVGDSRIVGYNYNRWAQRTATAIELDLPYKRVEDMDDVFLYLCPDKRGFSGVFGKGDKGVGNPIAYSRLKAADFTDPNPSLTWIEMNAEPIENEIKSPELAGIVGFRMSIVRADSGISFLD